MSVTRHERSQKLSVKSENVRFRHGPNIPVGGRIWLTGHNYHSYYSLLHICYCSIVQWEVSGVCVFLRWHRVWWGPELRRECRCPGSRSGPEPPACPRQTPGDKTRPDEQNRQTHGHWGTALGEHLSSSWSAAVYSRHTDPGSGWGRWRPCSPSQQPARLHKISYMGMLPFFPFIGVSEWILLFCQQRWKISRSFTEGVLIPQRSHSPAFKTFHKSKYVSMMSTVFTVEFPVSVLQAYILL